MCVKKSKLFLDELLSELLGRTEENRRLFYEKELQKCLEDVRNEAFLNGYQYAIQVLEDGLILKKK